MGFHVIGFLADDDWKSDESYFLFAVSTTVSVCECRWDGVDGMAPADPPQVTAHILLRILSVDFLPVKLCFIGVRSFACKMPRWLHSPPVLLILIHLQPEIPVPVYGWESERGRGRERDRYMWSERGEGGMGEEWMQREKNELLSKGSV